jgi:hypothetical protein
VDQGGGGGSLSAHASMSAPMVWARDIALSV